MAAAVEAEVASRAAAVVASADASEHYSRFGPPGRASGPALLSSRGRVCPGGWNDGCRIDLVLSCLTSRENE